SLTHPTTPHITLHATLISSPNFTLPAKRTSSAITQRIPAIRHHTHEHDAYPALKQSSESRLYTFSQETKDKLRKFRLGTSRAKDPQAIICKNTDTTSNPAEEIRTDQSKEDQIDKSNLEIQPEDNEVYTKIQDLQDELPDNTPRYILLSYPLTLSSGRLSVPYVMINYLPPTCSSEMRMLYAGAKELMKNTAEAGRIVEIDNVEELEKIEEILKGED
ncbi:Actin-depolymerizing factor gmf1, partial [Pseudocercospora fuligena]